MSHWVVFASSIAAIATLFVAFVAYAWQRKMDREHELQRERRAVYVELVVAYREKRLRQFESLTLDQWAETDAFDLIVEKVCVCATDLVVEQVLALQRGMDNWVDTLEDGEDSDRMILGAALDDWYHSTLWAMRQDSFRKTNVKSDLFTASAQRRLKLGAINDQ